MFLPGNVRLMINCDLLLEGVDLHLQQRFGLSLEIIATANY